MHVPAPRRALAALVLLFTACADQQPLPTKVRPQLVKLGEALIFDPILSGNKNISCMTYHLPGFATG